MWISYLTEQPSQNASAGSIPPNELQSNPSNKKQTRTGPTHLTLSLLLFTLAAGFLLAAGFGSFGLVAAGAEVPRLAAAALVLEGIAVERVVGAAAGVAFAPIVGYGGLGVAACPGEDYPAHDDG